MEHSEHLSLSWKEFLANKSLFGVLLLSAVAAMGLLVLFVVVDLAILLFAVPGAAETPELLLQAILSPGIFIPAVVLLLVQAVLILVVDAFFKAGFYGMAKNIVRNGGTQFSQFWPEAKAFFAPMTILQLIKSALIGVFAIPLLISLIPVISSIPNIDPGQIMALLGTGLFFVFALLIISVTLIYGEVSLVLRDLTAWGAIKETARTVKEHFGTTLFMILLMVLIMVVISLIQTLFTVPFDTLAKSTGVIWWSGVSGFFSLVFNIIFIAAGIVISLYVLHVYLELAGDTAPRKKIARKKA